MEFESKRLYFKEVESSDLEDIHHLHSNTKVEQFSTLGIPSDLSQTKERIDEMIKEQYNNKRKLYNWKVLLKDTNEFAGLAGLSLSLDKFKLGEIYYELHPDYWSKGFGTEISKQLIKIGFENFKLHKVEAGVATENVNSIRILEKCGMTREGLRRKILPIRGEWKDNYHYAIVEDDPRDY